ncbi:Bckap114 [Botrytis cinerea B05.10]|uniref:Bckap114 n=2 Tax=Botryotinia fuckeliana TaxID=40559 RepID=A0A384JZP0_BOTFB|nr:Bckap114 [Botrytis cinerea B05.10]ATZ56066.1 Bckap114 [Botrytis cinerea B05.10]EMR90886.1 putative importin-beta domain-containing protein [Botrytis cinerea BcDW1]
MASQHEAQLLQILADTQSSADGPRRQAEIYLKSAQAEPAFPSMLASIASHSTVPSELRQAALLNLKNFTSKNWTGHDDNGNPTIQIAEGTKAEIRARMLKIATDDVDSRKIKSAASMVVSKIANVDYPDQWPDLLPTILHIIQTGSDLQLHGSLKVLADVVEESLSEDQFFSVARDIVSTVYGVAINEARLGKLRALAVSVFRGTFDIMEMVKDEHGLEVKAFAEEVLKNWTPFLVAIMKQPLPPSPKESEEDGPVDQQWRGIIALKLQVVKTLMKIKSVFPTLLLPQSPVLFSATWAELTAAQPIFQEMYVDNDMPGRMEDADNLPYTLDFLVLEELDFLQSCLKAPPVQKELEAALQANSSVATTPWVVDVMKLAVNYAQILKEEEELWDIDVNLFLAEESSVTTQYTLRMSCGDLLIKLGEWLSHGALEGLLTYTSIIFQSGDAPWRMREAVLFLLTQLTNDFLDCDKEIRPEISSAFLPFIDYSINRGEPLLRARGYLVAGNLAQSIPQVSLELLDRTVRGVNTDAAEVVKVSCIKSIQGYILAHTVPADRQLPIIASISEFLHSKDLTELESADDLLVTLVESLRSAIQMDTRVTLADEGGALDLLFVLAKHGASNFQLTMLVTESFEEVVESFTGGPGYPALCTKVLPSLIGAFDVGSITDDDPLVELAADLLTILTENGSEPLPAGYVAAVLPKLNRLLMTTTEGGILRPGAEAIKYMLMHDHQQVFAWHDESNKSGLEVCLIIIDRLLGPEVEDNAASEVGGLAAELVEKAGQERLGPYLPQLLRAVATRLATAEAAPFIQSLILVFARLSLVGAHDVVEFLNQIEINGQSGLQVVLSKWLEHSVMFAGYDEIRQNVIALSKIFTLNDQRVVQTMVKGDLIVPTSNRIMTRSKAKLNPDQYTIIPASLKIIKVLIEELMSASGLQNAATAAAAAEFADEDGDDDSWEDLPNVLDLGLSSTKADLMAFGEGRGGFGRNRDDETQAYLTEFFVKAGRENLGGFNEFYEALSDEEKVKLQELAQGA